jgi:hypothetical protein
METPFKGEHESTDLNVIYYCRIKKLVIVRLSKSHPTEFIKVRASLILRKHTREESLKYIKFCMREHN